METLYILEICMLLLIACVALLCYQLSKLLNTLDAVYKREEMLYKIRTGNMLDYNGKVKPVRRKAVK